MDRKREFCNYLPLCSDAFNPSQFAIGVNLETPWISFLSKLLSGSLESQACFYFIICTHFDAQTMDQDNTTISEVRFPDQTSHDLQEVNTLYQVAIKERDDLREHVRQLEALILPQFDSPNGTNTAAILVSQKNSYLNVLKFLKEKLSELKVLMLMNFTHCKNMESKHSIDSMIYINKLLDKTDIRNNRRMRRLCLNWRKMIRVPILGSWGDNWWT